MHDEEKKVLKEKLNSLKKLGVTIIDKDNCLNFDFDFLHQPALKQIYKRNYYLNEITEYYTQYNFSNYEKLIKSKLKELKKKNKETLDRLFYDLNEYDDLLELIEDENVTYEFESMFKKYILGIYEYDCIEVYIFKENYYYSFENNKITKHLILEKQELIEEEYDYSDLLNQVIKDLQIPIIYQEIEDENNMNVINIYTKLIRKGYAELDPEIKKGYYINRNKNIKLNFLKEYRCVFKESSNIMTNIIEEKTIALNHLIETLFYLEKYIKQEIIEEANNE